MSISNIKFTAKERFLRYVKIDTQADASSPTCPSTEKQKNLGNLLVKELHEMGISDAELDEFGYVYATIPSTTTKNVPTICFCSHMDTAPDCSGEHVNPILHTNYQGGDIVLRYENQVLLPKNYPELAKQIGNDIITTDGTTLLGADDKAGVSEIMDAANYLISHPEIKHGKIRLLFTPDEEIGRGTDKVDLKKLGADFAYTMDGGTLGHIEDETFSADSAVLHIQGVSIHPGFAFGRLENAIKIASDIVADLPKDRLSPETTKDREGFIHPVEIKGIQESAKIEFILRDFDDDGLRKKAELLKLIAQENIAKYPGSSFKLEVKQQYRNMKNIIKDCPHVSDYAVEAIERAGITPHKGSVRGGTDGSRLSYMGLPCPNIFTGGHAFHSRQEWISVQDMQKAVEVIIHLCQIWEEKA